MSEASSSELKSCRHCGVPIREGERFEGQYIWPWIHKTGYYQCVPWYKGTRAEPAGEMIFSYEDGLIQYLSTEQNGVVTLAEEFVDRIYFYADLNTDNY